MKSIFFLTLIFLTLSFFVQGQNGEKMDFENYNPPSSLVVPEHPTESARFPFIDVHNHQWQMDSQNLTAVIAELGRQPRAAKAWFIKYQYRVMFGKDFWNPKEYGTYFRVLETADEYFPYYKQYHAYWKMYGLDLPEEVLKKLYYKNALKVIPGIDAGRFPESLNSLYNFPGGCHGEFITIGINRSGKSFAFKKTFQIDCDTWPGQINTGGQLIVNNG